MSMSEGWHSLLAFVIYYSRYCGGFAGRGDFSSRKWAPREPAAEIPTRARLSEFIGDVRWQHAEDADGKHRPILVAAGSW